MPNLPRSEWYDLTRDMNWDLTYVTEDQAFQTSLITTGVNVAFTVVAISLVDRVGRKPLLVVGFAIMLAGVLLAPRPTDREGVIESGMAIQRAIASEHFDEVRMRAVIELAYEQGFNPDGVGRQLLATLASGSRAEGLARLDLPALVIHGRQDRLVDFSGGQRTAELIAGADFLAFDDMAHDMPRVHWATCADAVSALIDRAA